MESILEYYYKIFDAIMAITTLVWGWPMILSLFIISLFMGYYLRFLQFTRLKLIVQNTLSALIHNRKKSYGDGTITPFQAVSSGLACCLGTGNISGVAVAISLGGAGAIFWMWIIALFASILKFCEITLALRYRNYNKEAKEYEGEFMWILVGGCGKKFIPLAKFWAIFMAIEMMVGPSMHSNAIAESIKVSFNINPIIIGVLLAALCGVILIGGIRRIGSFAEKVVPLMAIIYIAGAVSILIIKYQAIPAAFAMIIKGAFNPMAAAGGFAGSTVMLALRYGLSRGTASNEAGMGSAPFAHASAQTDFPARQGLWGIFEVFIDTIVICTITALIVLTSGVFGSEITGPGMTSAAFGTVLPHIGKYIVVITLLFFAFTSMITNAYFGKICFEYTFSRKIAILYFVLELIVIVCGSFMKFNYVWGLYDTFMAVTVFINLFVIVALRKEVKEETDKFLLHVNLKKL